MTNRKTVLNHYVPKFYLMNFSILGLGKSVWCFDKATRRKFKVNIGNIGCEKGFYNQEMEHYLASIESEASHVLRKLTDSRDLKNLLWHEREILAAFIVIQDNRTYELREMMKPVNKWLVEKIIASMPNEIKKSMSAEEINNYVNTKADEMAIETQRDILKNSVKLFSDMLLGLQWILLENYTETPYRIIPPSVFKKLEIDSAKLSQSDCGLFVAPLYSRLYDSSILLSIKSCISLRDNSPSSFPKRSLL